MNVEKTICSYVSALSFDMLSDNTKKIAKKAFIDTTAAILSGSRREQGKMAARALEADLQKEADKSFPTVWGYGHRGVKLGESVFLNAVFAHSCEYNDLFYGLPGHPSAVLAPVVFGLGEKLHKNGKEVLTAYVAGMEILGRINMSLMPEHHIKGFHSTSTAGIIGAALAAGKLLGLSEEKLNHACCLASTFACGLRGNFGYTGNSLHVGNAAEGGLKAALYAKEGVQAKPVLLTFEEGFLHAFGGSGKKLESFAERLDNETVFETPGLLFKKYPICFSAYQAVEAAVEIRKEGNFRIENIEKILCETSPNHYMSLPSKWPSSVYGQRFCIPFCVCFALSGGSICLKELDRTHYKRKDLKELGNRMEYKIDAEQTEEKGFGRTKVTVILKDGRGFESEASMDTKERAENWSRQRQREKLRESTEGLWKNERVDLLIDGILNLEEADDFSAWMEHIF